MKKDKQLKDIKRRRTCKIVCVLLFLLISVIGICVHFNIIKIPFVVDLLERTEQKQEFGDFSGQLIGESYIPKEENIVYDNDSKTSGYVNNMILIFAYSDVPRKQIVNIADSLGGSIVGEIPEIYQYQIQVGAMDKESLEFYCKKVMRFKEVKYAIIDRVYSMEKEDIALPNDPWRDVFQGILGVDWNEEKPQGYNWWIEASKVLSAWQYNESLATINVGVVDNGFDTSHEDLNITVLNNEVNSVEHHGTHVAGIIGATNNNETGITGILDKVQLYGVDCYATSKQKKDLKTIYTAANEETARKQLETVTKKWSGQYPSAMNHWYNNWDAISPIFKFSKDVRTAFYTTNAIESLNSCYRRLNKQRSVFPSSQALKKALYLSTFEIAKKWTMSIRN